MRLLKNLPNGEFELISFDDDFPPPYAILSHTWTEGEEVTYGDLVAGTGKCKTGYGKLRFCGDRAARDGLDYFWVDTCCINKSTIQELQTTINGMFRYYQRASRCYVYLSDVEVSEEIIISQASQTMREEMFRQSRWFTRGWTLQELLAPATVQFFSKECKWLGSRTTLEQEIHDITRVSISALQGQSLTDFSVEERMRWAANRSTTFKEDKVYCMLGIFGVFLPLNYGEGEAHAAVRLREEIQRRQEGWGTESLQDLIVSKPWRGILKHPLLHSFEGHREYVRCIAFSLDGKQLASGSADCTVRLWEVATGSTLQELKGHVALVEGVAFSPDGERLASASEDGSVRLWDVSTGSALQTLGNTIQSNTDKFSLRNVVYHVAFSPDSMQLASGQWNGMVKLWDVATGSTLQTLENAHRSYISDVAFSRDGKWLATASGEVDIKIWEIAARLRVLVVHTLKGHDRYVRRVTFSPDSKRLASAGADGTVRLWDVETGAILQVFRDSHMLKEAQMPRASAGFWGSIMELDETTTVKDVVFSGDGKQLMSASEVGTVRLWDVAREARAVRNSTFGMNQGILSTVAISPDLKRLASTQGSTHVIQLWDILEN